MWETDAARLHGGVDPLLGRPCTTLLCSERFCKRCPGGCRTALVHKRGCSGCWLHPWGLQRSVCGRCHTALMIPCPPCPHPLCLSKTSLGLREGNTSSCIIQLKNSISWIQVRSEQRQRLWSLHPMVLELKVAAWATHCCRLRIQ